MGRNSPRHDRSQTSREWWHTPVAQVGKAELHEYGGQQSDLKIELKGESK
jgi:hypothetical protein